MACQALYRKEYVSERHCTQQNPEMSDTKENQSQRPSVRIEPDDRTLFAAFPVPVLLLGVDGKIACLNPAFNDTFGWTFAELSGSPLSQLFPTLENFEGLSQRLFQEHALRDIATQCTTKDGCVRDVLLDGALLHDVNNTLTGLLFTVKDVTGKKLADRRTQSFFRIFEELHHFQELDGLLQFITQKVKSLLHVRGTMVILADEERQEFFFRTASLDTQDSGRKFQEVRFPIGKGVAGQVYKTGKPLLVPDTSRNPYFFKKVDEDAQYETRNMLDVPISTGKHRIGVLCAVNKFGGEFTQDDLELLSAIAGTIVLPLENARINEQLRRSYEDVQSLNRAKDRVIHHLSHELKTPVSVLSASLALLQKRLAGFEGPGQQGYKRILDRAQRNLQRILDMQYEIEDILREKEYTSYHLLSMLLDACVDELDVLITDELGEWSLMQRVRRRIEELFGPRESISRKIKLDQFVERQIERLRPRFAHRACRLSVQIKSTPAIQIPPDVLAKVVEGLVRNAIENTPDGSKIDVTVRNSSEGPELEIKDFGIGISEENQRLIFENYFPSYETMQYSSKKPYDFQAGGKGFDLLRMKIFSERYHFKIRLYSRRCGYVPPEKNLCPGDVTHCAHCRRSTDCLLASGTTVIVQFSPAAES